MNIKYSSTLLGAALGLALISAPAHGAITVLDSATGLNNAWTDSGPASLTFTGLDLTGGSKLVVSIGTQATASGTDWTSVTFDSAGMTEAARLRNGSNIQSGIYYLDNLTGLSASGNLTIAAGGSLFSRGITATAWVLSGTAAGVGNSGATAGAGTSLTTTAANSWVLAATTLASTTIPTAQSPLTDGLGLTNPYSGSNETSIGTGYQTVATSGTSLTPTFDIGASTAAAEFTVVPEPAAALFGALGLLALLRRRR